MVGSIPRFDGYKAGEKVSYPPVASAIHISDAEDAMSDFP